MSLLGLTYVFYVSLLAFGCYTLAVATQSPLIGLGVFNVTLAAVALIRLRRLD